MTFRRQPARRGWRVQVLRTATLGIGILVLGGCGEAKLSSSVGSSATGVTAASTVPGSTTSTTVDPGKYGPLQDPRSGIDYLPWSINHLVNSTDLAVEGTITAISSSRWNSPDGTPWTMPPPQVHLSAPPLKYRIVDLKLTNVLFSSSSYPGPKAVGDTVQVWADGDGTATGAGIGAPGVEVTENNSTGPIASGSTVLLLLYYADTPLENAPGPKMLAFDYSRNWTESGVNAMNLDPQRTVPLVQLKARLYAEKAKGRVADETPAQASLTYRNPLG